jgi:serine/threonine-protein kinase HipA
MGNGVSLIPAEKVRMVMAWQGKNRHYLADSLRRRHIDSTAFKCGYGESAKDLVDEIIEQTPTVLEQVSAELPPVFPERLARCIFAGLAASAQRLQDPK